MTAVLLLVALALLGWGYYRAKPLGPPGILAWLQSATLMAPWLLLFTLMGLEIRIPLAGVLLTIVLSIGVYIYLGRRLRELANLDALAPPPVQSEEMPAAGEPSPTINTDAATVSPQSKITSPPVPAEDLKAMQGIFGIDTFFITETIPYQDGVIFQGNLRGEVEEVYDRLSQKLEAALGHDYNLFLVANPEGKPVVIVLPSHNSPQPMGQFQRGFAVVLALSTFGTCLASAAFLRGFDLLTHWERLGDAFPIAFGIFMILVVHELAHQALARKRQVKLSLPFFFPALQIGSFGAFNRFESLLPNRTVLFDVALAGPAAGGLLSLCLLLMGLFLSSSQSSLQMPVPFFQGSVLVGTLARMVLGNALQADVVGVDPLVIIGWIGLVITALNLMPAGQLDGGRITQAIYGRKVAGQTTVVTLIVLAIASLVNPLALYWAIVVLFLQRDLERPSLNELTEPDDTRAALGLLALFMMAAVLIPLNPGLAGRLGIGG